MTQYINKDTLVAELNRLITELVEEGEDTMFEQGRISAFEDVKVFINHTLEVKEIPEYTHTECKKIKSCVRFKDIMKMVKHIVLCFLISDSL